MGEDKKDSMTTEHWGAESDRLADDVLARDATWLLACNDPHTLVVSLLRTVRQHDDKQQSIRDGYEFSYRAQAAMHQIELDAQVRHIASAIEREERKGEWSAPARQEITYCGGLRRAARIARGFRPRSSSLSFGVTL